MRRGRLSHEPKRVPLARLARFRSSEGSVRTARVGPPVLRESLQLRTTCVGHVCLTRMYCAAHRRITTGPRRCGADARSLHWCTPATPLRSLHFRTPQELCKGKTRVATFHSERKTAADLDFPTCYYFPINLESDIVIWRHRQRDTHLAVDRHPGPSLRGLRRARGAGTARGLRAVQGGRRVHH